MIKSVITQTKGQMHGSGYIGDRNTAVKLVTLISPTNDQLFDSKEEKNTDALKCKLRNTSSCVCVLFMCVCRLSNLILMD